MRSIIIDNNYWGHNYALYLLAQFRSYEAYPLVMEMLSLPSEKLDLLFDDFIGLDKIMATLSGGDPKLIQQLIENPNADEHILGRAMDALVVMYVNEMIRREDLINYFKELFEGKIVASQMYAWDFLITYCAAICADELQDHIWNAFDLDLVWEGYISRKSVQDSFELGQEKAIAKLKENSDYHLVDDIFEEISWWACFNEDKEEDFASRLLEAASQLISEEEVEQFGKRQARYYSNPDSEIPSEPVGTEPKIGRNEPCPCGSKKKYKKCCGKLGA